MNQDIHVDVDVDIDVEVDVNVDVDIEVGIDVGASIVQQSVAKAYEEPRDLNTAASEAAARETEETKERQESEDPQSTSEISEECAARDEVRPHADLEVTKWRQGARVHEVLAVAISTLAVVSAGVEAEARPPNAVGREVFDAYTWRAMLHRRNDWRDEGCGDA